MSDFFKPNLFPNGVPAAPPVDPTLQAMPAAPAVDPLAIAQAAPVPSTMPAQPVQQKPIFIPVPIMTKPVEKKRSGMVVTNEVARKAQGVYPAEKADKQNMVNNSKMPTASPIGAWGKPS